MNEFIEKLIGRLEEEKKYCSYHPHTRDEAINKAIEIVNQLAQEFNNGWIPCSERLPENEDEVLCWYEYRIMQGTCEGEMKQTYGIGYYFNHFKRWGGEVNCGRDCKVIAWQPLPQPYKEGSE